MTNWRAKMTRNGDTTKNHALKLEKAKELSSSGLKVFDKDKLLEREEDILEEAKFLGLSSPDIEEILKRSPRGRSNVQRKEDSQKWAYTFTSPAKTSKTFGYKEVQYSEAAKSVLEYVKAQRLILQRLESLWESRGKQQWSELAAETATVEALAMSMRTTLENMTILTRLVSDTLTTESRSVREKTGLK
jgi:hypothetical protein